jgi:hypothetical protein
VANLLVVVLLVFVFGDQWGLAMNLIQIRQSATASEQSLRAQMHKKKYKEMTL